MYYNIQNLKCSFLFHFSSQESDQISFVISAAFAFAFARECGRFASYIWYSWVGRGVGGGGEEGACFAQKLNT